MARSLQELQKQYNSSAAAQKAMMMRGPGGPRGGMGAKGKPKNTKQTIKIIAIHAMIFRLVVLYSVQCLHVFCIYNIISA